MSFEERDVSQEHRWYYQQLVKKCAAALTKNGIAAHCVDTRDEALTKVLSMIPEGVRIGLGDSVTLDQVGVVQALEKRGGHEILSALRKNGKYSFPTDLQEGRKALAADYFLTGTNAVTLDGKLVYADGRGNRVAGVIYGSEKAIVVAGANKIVTNVTDALTRIKLVAAPLNAKRHYLKHAVDNPPPCALTGICIDCNHPRRICNFTVIVEHQTRPRLEVVLIAEELGL